MFAQIKQMTRIQNSNDVLHCLEIIQVRLVPILSIFLRKSNNH